MTVTLVDGLVHSRTALFHSMNYRRVPERCGLRFGGAGAEIAREGRRHLLEGMVARYSPGRTVGRDYDNVPDDHLDPTAFIALRIEELSAKFRQGVRSARATTTPALPAPPA